VRGGMLMGVPLAVYFAVRFSVLEGSGVPLYELSAVASVATALFALARYTLLLVWPVGLDAHYPYQPIATLGSQLVVVSAAMLALVATCVVKLRCAHPNATFWLLWVYICLLPVLVFGRFGDVIIADRFLYIPSVGLALLGGHALGWLVSQRAPAFRGLRPAGVWGAVAAVALLAVASLERTRIWHDDLALFSDMIRTSPHSALVHSNLGMALYSRNRLDEALEPLRRAVAIEPRYAAAWNTLAAIFDRQGRREVAARAYARALRLAPDMLEARINAAHLQVRMGRRQEGLRALETIVARHPRNGGALYALAHAVHALSQQGQRDQTDRAVDLLRRARASDPTSPVIHYLLGKIEAERGNAEEAAAAMRAFLRLWPDEDDAFAVAARRIAERHPAQVRHARP
jgi:Flp pilus assembly protein TadD